MNRCPPSRASCVAGWQVHITTVSHWLRWGLFAWTGLEPDSSALCLMSSQDHRLVPPHPQVMHVCEVTSIYERIKLCIMGGDIRKAFLSSYCIQLGDTQVLFVLLLMVGYGLIVSPPPPGACV
jgi:hypothetical protein